jgi:hypothetical protein
MEMQYHGKIKITFFNKDWQDDTILKSVRLKITGFDFFLPFG